MAIPKQKEKRPLAKQDTELGALPRASGWSAPLAHAPASPLAREQFDPQTAPAAAAERWFLERPSK